MSTIIFNAPEGSVKVELISNELNTSVEYQLNTTTPISDSDLATGNYNPVEGVMPRTFFRVTPLGDAEIGGVSNNFESHGGHSLTFSIDGDLWESNYFLRGALTPSQDIVVDIGVLDGERQPFSSPLSKNYVVNTAKLSEISTIDPINVNLPTEPNKSEYIINIINIPFKLPDGFIGDVENVRFGASVETIQTETLTTDLLEIDLGVVDLTDLGGDSLDYLQSTFKLHLPFVDSVLELEPSLVMGVLVEIVMLLDVYNGDVTINVYGGDYGLILSEKASVGREIPFGISQESIKLTPYNTGIENGLLNAYITHHRPELAIGEKNNLITTRGLLSDTSGYVELDYINLKFKATLNEKNDIINALQNGVIINE